MLSNSNRYGGGGTPAEGWARRISGAFTGDVNDMDGGGVKFIHGWFSWSNTIKLGKVVGATPNGRRNGEPINHGANPHPGFRKDGALSAMSNAICAIQPGFEIPPLFNWSWTRKWPPMRRGCKRWWIISVLSVKEVPPC